MLEMFYHIAPDKLTRRWIDISLYSISVSVSTHYKLMQKTSQ